MKLIPAQEIHLALQKLKAAQSHSYKDKEEFLEFP